MSMLTLLGLSLASPHNVREARDSWFCIESL